MLYGFLNTFAFPRSPSLILCNSVFYYFILKRLISGICPLHPQTYDGHSVVYLCLPFLLFSQSKSTHPSKSLDVTEKRELVS